MKRRIVILLAVLLPLTLTAQSKSFNIGKWTEVFNSIVKELNRSYVDTLPLDRMYRAGVNAMLEELDPYTVYIPVEEDEDLQMLVNKSYGGIGAVIYKPDKESFVKINEPYENSPAALAGLRCGDEIMAIDGQTTVGLTASEASSRMKGKPGTEVKFHVRKVYTGEEVDVKIVRRSIHFPDIEYSGILEDGKTGYIYQSGFTEGVGDEIRSIVKDFKSKGVTRIILDLRGNGGGLLQEAVNIVSVFVPKGSVVVSSKGNGTTADMVYSTEKEPLDTEIPLTVLVDSGSASASEIVSGALQDYDRAVIMGRRTYGKGLVQVIRPLPYNGKLKITTSKYYTPSGRCVQAIDYSHRNEDGSVGSIPDSLTHEFKTAGGRIVKDGGGITPDNELALKDYSRLTYSLVMNGVVDQYALKYVSEHKDAPALEDFHFTDYEDFIEYAKTQKFDYRSGARAYYDKMREELRRDKLEDGMKETLDALQKALEMEKEEFLRLKKDEIIPFIEEEIAVRYYFQRAGVQVRLRYDDQLKQALQILDSQKTR